MGSDCNSSLSLLIFLLCIATTAQQQQSKKLYHLMFSIETFAHETFMLDNNLLLNRVL